MNEIYDVVIVGAGPIGLATAIGLRQRGIENILVIDRTRAFRQVGQVIDLLPNGLTALKYLAADAYEAVKQASFKLFNSAPSQNTKISSEWTHKNLQGEKIRSIPLGYDVWFQKYGEGRLSISWYELQTSLRNLLPSERVQPNHRCINLVDEPELGCVRVDCISSTGIEFNPYAHWEEGQKQEDIKVENSENSSQQSEIKSIRAKLVVGADGINSTVRQVLYKDQPYESLSKPEYSGFAAIGCREITDTPKDILSEIEEKFFQGARIVTISPDSISGDSANIENPRMILFHRPSGQLGYLIHLPLPIDSLKGKSETELIDLALVALEKANFPNAIKQLVKISPPENIQHRPYYIHRATLSDPLPFPSTACLNATGLPSEIQPDWYARRVVLVGDAAHGMPPFMAQGANQGLEDALIVATSIANLAQKNLWDDTVAIAGAFEKYQSLRRPFMVDIQQATLRRIIFSSEQEWEGYNQQVYRRNFAEIIQGLLI
ncbi:MAG: NAD(P)/FAD-dependent oxidoreductase [Phormidium sp.]